MDYAWYVKYGPRSYLPLMEFDARQHAYKFLLATLLSHQKDISQVPDPERCKSPGAKSNAIRDRYRAIAALETVGAWWKDANQAEIRPHVSKRERRAFELCAKVIRLSDKALKGLTRTSIRAMKRYTAALQWQTKRLGETLKQANKPS